MRAHRLAALAGAAILLLTGCSDAAGTGDPTPSPTTTETAPEAALEVEVPEGWHYVEGQDAPTASADPQLPVTVTDDTGAEVEIDDVSRIIVGGDDIADILGALGLGDMVYAAPADGASPYATGAEVQFEFSQNTGTEGLLSIDGTLFIGNNPNRHGDVAAQFRQAGVAAVVYDDQQPTADKIRAVASYVGAADAGEEIASAVEAQLEEASSYADDLADLQVLQVTSSGAGGSNAVVGSGTAGADIMAAIGATSVGVETGLRGYSREYSDEGLLSTQPDVILMGTADLEAWGGVEGFVEAFPTLLETPAGQDEQIYVMPSTQIKVSGPSLGAGALALAEALASRDE